MHYISTVDDEAMLHAKGINGTASQEGMLLVSEHNN